MDVQQPETFDQQKHREFEEWKARGFAAEAAIRAKYLPRSVTFPIIQAQPVQPLAKRAPRSQAGIQKLQKPRPYSYRLRFNRCQKSRVFTTQQLATRALVRQIVRSNKSNS